MTHSLKKTESFLSSGIYDALLDEELQSILIKNPELRSIIGKIDPEEQPFRYSFFISKLIEKALHLENNTSARINLCNQLISLIANSGEREYLILSCHH